MVFSNKKQARIWLVSIVYKLLMREEVFPLLPDGISSVQELVYFFEDEIVFSYEKGDIDYFKTIYSAISQNILQIEDKISNSLKLKSLNPFVKACLICATAELDYTEIDKKTVNSRYKEIIRNHSFDGSEKVIDLLLI